MKLDQWTDATLARRLAIWASPTGPRMVRVIGAHGRKGSALVRVEFIVSQKHRTVRTAELTLLPNVTQEATR